MAAQGTPSNISGNTFTYGFSRVEFWNGRVVGWANISNNLRVALKPAVPTTAATFTRGSTEDEVLAAQGTPTNVSGKHVHVRLLSGRVH